MTTSKSEKTRLSTQDWVNAAEKLLAEGGIDAVRVEPLARVLKVTKGSFYWHFTNRRSLLDAVLNSWRKRATKLIILRLNESEMPPLKRLTELLKLPKHGSHARQGANLETAIRQWAIKDKAAEAAVNEVDQHRLIFIQSNYKELGYSEAEAHTKAVFFYCVMQGISNIPELVSEETLESGKSMIESGFLSDQQ